jgi:stage II sporulation protein P
MFSRLNNRMILALLLIIILLGLNIKKFYHFKEVVPVWSSYDQSYYDEDEEMGFLDKTKSFFAPDNILYRLTRIRVRAPITYLKREIPLLAYYTPEALREPVKTIYQPAEDNRVIKLKFDLRGEVRKEEIEERPEPEVVKKIMDYQPLVFIYHTHTSETYVDDPRIQDNNAHVLPGNIGYVARVGAELADLLSGKYNFRVVHTTDVHDVSYARSYLNSRQTVKNFLEKQEKVDLILDIHRDGVKKATRDTVTTVINGKKAARIMIVVTNGKFDFAHLELEDRHPEWERNLDFARRLTAKMNEFYPGLLQRLEIRDTIYNQDLHPHSLLLEIGDYRNTTEEALYSAHLLAKIIAALFAEG